MGYQISSLTNLPSLAGYYFLLSGVNYDWQSMGGVSKSLYQQFSTIAKELGPNSAIVHSLQPERTDEELRKMLNKAPNYADLKKVISRRVPVLIILRDVTSFKEPLNNESYLQYITFDSIDKAYSSEFEFISDIIALAKDDDKSLLIKTSRVNNDNDITIGIITALPIEFAAVEQYLINKKVCYTNNRDNKNYHIIGTLKSADDKKHNIVLTMCGEGNNKAATRCTQLLNDWPTIKGVILCGIAGGVPNPEDAENHVRLGDIVVATSVLQYDYGKRTNDGWEEKAIPHPTSISFHKVIDKMKADEYRGQFTWKKYIKKYAVNQFAKPDVATDIMRDQDGNIIDHPEDKTRTAYPRIHYGCIASANSVLKDSKIREHLRKQNKVLAVEMEGSGITDAAIDQNVDYIIIRGICDYCDSYKNDIWQDYAALVAAAYTRSLIENMPSY